MSGRGGVLAAAGSVAAAVVASACCWLPAVLVAFGVSAAGVAVEFEAVRPWFLGGAAGLLAVGFYLAYLRKPACGPGGTCPPPSPRLRRRNRAMLWVAALVVLAVGLYPRYAGLLAAGGARDAAGGADAASEVLTVPIEGMTCEACALPVREALLELAGVADASVSYAAGTATVFGRPGALPSREQLAAAVGRAGFRVPD